MFAKVKPNTQIIGQNIIYFNQVDSTNQFASELIKQNLADNGTVIVAEYQTQGRGQHGRSWISEPFENLLFSVILKYVTNSPNDPFLVNKMATLAIYDYLHELLPDEKVRIKWPNDLLVNGKKICGILVENNYLGQKINYSIVGIGLNVNQNYEHIRHINATSLGRFSEGELNREDILIHLLEHFEHQYEMLLEGRDNTINAEFDKALYGYGELGTFETAEGIRPGILEGCDKDGRLLVEFEGIQEAYIHGSIKQFIA